MKPAALLGFVLALSLIDRVIFQPTPGEDFTPAQLGIAAEDVFLTTEDGVRVHAYWLPAPAATRALIFLHGNGGNASHRLPNAASLRGLGINVLLADYRGYGKSEGVPSEAGVYADARAALEHVTKTRGISEQRVVVFGRSLGGAVAVELGRGRALAGMILESTFTSVADMAGSLKFVAVLLGRPFDSAAKIGEMRSPLLFFHGDADTIVPYALGRRLFEQAPEPKAFETLRGAGHNDTFEVGGAAYLERIRRFLDEVAPAVR